MNPAILVAVVDDDADDRLLAKRFVNQSTDCRCVGDYASATDALILKLKKLKKDATLIRWEKIYPGKAGNA